MDPYTDEDLARLVLANLRAAKEAEVDEDNLALYVASHIMAVIMGAIDPAGEAVIVTDPDFETASEEDLLHRHLRLMDRDAQSYIYL